MTFFAGGERACAEKLGEKKLGWASYMRIRLDKLEKKYPEKIGIFVKDLESGEEFTHRGEKLWYIASGVKVPIAIELLRQVEEGKQSLKNRVRIEASDFVDGTGETNLKLPGSRVSLHYLLEQMLIFSDNTASDLLLREIGLENVNALLQLLSEKGSVNGFREITTLREVRMLAYGEIHPSARSFTSEDLLAIKSAGSGKKRFRKIASLLPAGASARVNLDEAFERYYSRGLNSATLTSYGIMLERLYKGEWLNDKHTNFLLGIMRRAETGKKRIRAGFSPKILFAHKTGTQHKRVCDLGIAWNGLQPGAKRVLIVACTKNFSKAASAEQVLKDLGKDLEESGLFANGTI